MTSRKQLQLLVELAQVSRRLLRAAKFLPHLLWLAHDDALDVLVTRLQPMVHDGDVD